MAILEGIKRVMTNITGNGIYEGETYEGGIRTYTFVPTNLEMGRFPKMRYIKDAQLQLGLDGKTIKMLLKTIQSGKIITHSAIHLENVDLADLDQEIDRLAKKHSEHEVFAGPAISIVQDDQLTTLRHHKFKLYPDSKVGIWLELRDMAKTVDADTY